MLIDDIIYLIEQYHCNSCDRMQCSMRKHKTSEEIAKEILDMIRTKLDNSIRNGGTS